MTFLSYFGRKFSQWRLKRHLRTRRHFRPWLWAEALEMRAVPSAVTSNEEFVDRAYRDLLHRPVEPFGARRLPQTLDAREGYALPGVWTLSFRSGWSSCLEVCRGSPCSVAPDGGRRTRSIPSMRMLRVLDS